MICWKETMKEVEFRTETQCQYTEGEPKNFLVHKNGKWKKITGSIAHPSNRSQIKHS